MEDAPQTYEELGEVERLKQRNRILEHVGRADD